MSFVFDVTKDHWSSSREREVEEARLYEVSFVAFPAYPATSTGTRNALKRMQLRLMQGELDRTQRFAWRHNGRVTTASDEAELLRAMMLYKKGLVGSRQKRVFAAEVRAS